MGSVESDRFVEFGGGLGDVFQQIYNTDRYVSLEKLDLSDRMTVVIVSHNPHVKEIFEWHRNRQKMVLKDLGYWLPNEDAEKRKRHGIPRPDQGRMALQKSVTFYPSPQDIPILKSLTTVGKYVIFATAAGTEPSRDLPKALRDDAVAAVLSRGYKAVITGRRYKLFDRDEHCFQESLGVVNLVDQLTVPGTAMAVERAQAVVTCHSALCSLSWCMNKPTFVAYPGYVYERHFKNKSQYAVGQDRPDTMHLEFSKYCRGDMDRFLDLL